MVDEKTAGVTFGSYGKSFQEKIVQAFLMDRQFAEQMVEVFDVSYLEPKYLIFLSQRYFNYLKKYKNSPTMQLLLTIVRDELKVGNDVLLRDQVVDYLQRIKSNPDPGDLQYVKEKALDFCRKQALKKAFETAIDQMQAENYEQIVEGIKRAVTVGTVPDLGHDFFDDIEARFVREARNPIPTGLEELDHKDILNGGLGRGEIAVITAATGVGKSHFLTMIGANAMRAGLNVLHYTFELSHNIIGLRYDSNLSGIPASDIYDHKEAVVDAYKNTNLGRLKIKYFPTNSASIYTLRSHIERLELNGFKPDVVIIDYADIMRSTRQFDSLRHELKLIYEELRGFAGEKGFPIWTASQSNKEGSDAEVIDLTNMSEAYGKAMVADVVIGLSRRPYEKARGTGRLFVAKNRAGRDGIIFPVHIDTARSMIQIVGAGGAPEDAKADDASAAKRALREKWKELKHDLDLKKVVED